VTAYLRIHGGVVDVYDGCNAGSGPARVRGDRLEFGDRIQTLRACLDGRGTVANSLASLLRGSTAYRVEERTLTITRGERSAQFRAVDSEPAHD
jgi:heat shock protein HslJ